MPNPTNYPFKSAIQVNGKTYIAVEELNEILENLQKLGPAFQQVADATEKIKTIFSDGKSKTDNLLVELQGAAGNLKEIQGEN